jgi:hypothetical protein
MSQFVSATPVRSNLAQMLLQLKELPPDMVSDSLNKFVSLERTPQYLKVLDNVPVSSAILSSSTVPVAVVRPPSRGASSDVCAFHLIFVFI